MNDVLKVVDVYVIIDEEFGELEVFSTLRECKDFFKLNSVGIFVQDKDDENLWRASESEVYIMKREVLFTGEANDVGN